MAQKESSNVLLWIIGIILIALGVVYFLTQNAGQQAAQDQPTEEPIEIGVITPLTGDEASYGTNMQRIYDIAVSEINEAGGVNGRQVELIYEDGKCRGANATTAAQKLININDVEVILGGTCSGETLAAAEVTQQARVLLISPSATSPDISDAGDLVYRTYPSDAFEADLMAGYADGVLAVEKAAIISENTDFAQGVRKAFTKAFVEENGKELVFDEQFNPQETDFRSLMDKLKASNPEVVYLIPQSPAAGQLLLKQMQEKSINATVLAANTMLDRSTIAQNAALYEGVVLSEVTLEPSNPKYANLLETYRQSFGSDPEFSGFTAAAYDSVHLVAEAMREVGDDAEAIAQYFDTQVKDWPGAIGTLNFDENGDPQVPLTLVEVRGGELEEIKQDE